MKKLEIELTDKQYEKLLNEIKNGTEINIEEETFSGYSIALNVIEGGISWIDFEMLRKIDIGEVSWSFK